MAVLRAGFNGTVGQSSAQIIDGSLKFDDGAPNQLRRTPTVDGNKKTWTWSGWVKRSLFGSEQVIFGVTTASNNYAQIYIDGSDKLTLGVSTSSIGNNYIVSNRVLRDTGWYHIVAIFNSTLSNSADRLKLYVNGERITSFSASSIGLGQNTDGPLNDNVQHVFSGKQPYGSGQQLDGHLSQCYLIDGLELGPGYFGFTDPLTNTWRPKKFRAEGTTVNDGTVWSNTYTASDSFQGAAPATNGFDGSTTTRSACSSSGCTVTFTPSAPIVVKNSLRVYSGYGSASVNGGSSVDYSTSSVTWQDLSFTGFLTSLAITGNASGNNANAGEIYALEVDGVIMKDSTTTNLSFGTNGFYLPFDGNSPIDQDKSGNGNDFTPVNFGGSNSVDKATGALPILNTTPGGVSASVGVRTDANANSLALALPLASDLNAVTNQINSGVTNRTILSHNNPSSSTTKSNFYGRSYYLDGSQAITIGVIGTDLQFGSDDFTMEIWFNSNTTLNSTYWNPIVSFPWHGGNNTNSQLWIGFAGGAYSPYSAGELHARIKTASGLVELPTGILTAYNDNAWHHVAVTRNGSTASIYVDGALRSTASISGSVNTSYGSYEAFIGAYDHGGGGFNAFYKGYVSDFRVYKGAAKYTSDFVVSSTNPDILPDTPSGVSGGSKLTKITDGAVSFDGSGDYLSLTDNADFELGSGDFTIEFYAYPKSLSSDSTVISKYSSSNKSYLVWMNSTTVYFTYSTNGSSNAASLSVTYSVPLNKWTHFAMARNGSTLNMFIDGVLVASPSISGTLYDGSSDLQIGRQEDGAQYYWNGFISNVRIVKGTALYTANFTPSVVPLTNVTNTKLLTCQSTKISPGTASYDDAVLIMPMNGANNGTTFTDISTSSHTPSNVAGNTKTSTAYSKFYGSSGYFDGTGDYLDMGDSNDWIPQLGWTVEMWVYITGGTNSQRSLISQAGSGGSNQSFQILIQGTNKFACSIRNNNGNSWADANSNSAIPENQWVHLAVVVESGGTVKLYVDGTAQTETATFQGTGYNTSEEMWIGGQAHPSYPAYFTGYMNDVAMYQTAKYTSNFTPTTTGLLNSQPSIPAAVSPGTVSPKGNTSATNFNPFTTDINTVRGQETGYATLNPLAKDSSYALSNGNLSYSGDVVQGLVASTIFASSGKYYCEYQLTTQQGDTGIGVGDERINPGEDWIGEQSYQVGYLSDGRIFQGGSSTSYSSFTVGDVIGAAFDADTGKVYFAKNNIWQNSGNPAAGTGQVKTISGGNPLTFTFRSVGSGAGTVNFGQKPFKFPPPDGFQPLNLTNTLPETVIARPDQYVGVKTFTGNGGTQSIDVGHEPDLVWLKDRGAGEHHGLFDTIRGPLMRLVSDYDYASTSRANTVTSFNYNGVTLGSAGEYNGNNDPIVCWSWKAGGSKNTFNVDDVGYANASNVNMSVGALDNVALDKSATWSSSLTASNGFISGSYDATKAFNGFTSGNHSGTNSGGTLTFSPNLTIPANSIIEVYAGSAESARMDITVNGVANNSTPGGRFVKVQYDNSTTLSSLTVYRTGGGNSADLRGIRINGKLLVDSGVSINAPAIAATGCSVGTEQGFSIIKYDGSGTAGDTIPHGLLQTPEFIIVKDMDDTDNWQIYHAGAQTSGAKLLKFTTDSATSNNGPWNDTAPTSKLISLGGGGTNDSNNSHICYAWHSVPGLQKFGKYTGNASTNPFIELGFRPALLWIKNTSSNSTDWVVIDSQRQPFNQSNLTKLYISSANSESTIGVNSQMNLDFLSNGFKLRDSNNKVNASNDVYIYCAWAEAPAFNLYGGQSNAR